MNDTQVQTDGKAGGGLEIKLAHFEGPLDLLLHLVEKAEIDIADIFISDITSQYMAMMQQAEGLDMDRSSSFLQMAAHLLYIKSRALLPRTRRQESDEDIDPEALLIQQIHDYKACKQAAEELIASQEVAAKSFVRLPEEYPLPPPKVVLTDLPVDALYQAFMGIMLREAAEEKRNAERHIERDAYSIGDQMDVIRGRIGAGQGPQRLDAFFPRNGGRLGIIVTFMALLELMNQKLVTVAQEDEFGAILVQGLGDVA